MDGNKGVYGINMKDNVAKKDAIAINLKPNERPRVAIHVFLPPSLSPSISGISTLLVNINCQNMMGIANIKKVRSKVPINVK